MNYMYLNKSLNVVLLKIMIQNVEMQEQICYSFKVRPNTYENEIFYCLDQITVCVWLLVLT